ncbi:delta 9-fatty acid desaturase protein, partial [Hymenopellis radicata]
LPPITGVRWFNVFILVATPLIGLHGCFYVEKRLPTVCFAVVHYVFTMLGYHRLWSHRSYNASFPLQIFLLAGGTSAVQGSCYWWSRGHRSHHRYTDTEQDPYNSNRGLLWTHIGWMIFKSDLHSGYTDVSDLRNDALLHLQHRWYFQLAILFGFVVPTAIPGFLWGDWRGGFWIAAALRLTIAHHSTFCINSVAHYLGTTPYDDRLSPRDHFLSAILTMGEGYHNFHHQFPMDYRNAIKWYQYDPTKWFIALCETCGLANHLRMFSSNEIMKGALTMQLKKLKYIQDSLEWPTPLRQLPVFSWEEFQERSKSSSLILIAGFIHDASSFAHEHPGGSALIHKSTGLDMTDPSLGGLQSFKCGAQCMSLLLLSMMRVGVLHGGVETPSENALPPSQALYVGTRKSLP